MTPRNGRQLRIASSQSPDWRRNRSRCGFLDCGEGNRREGRYNLPIHADLFLKLCGRAAVLLVNRSLGLQIQVEMEQDMGQALVATQLLFYLLGGLGLFFVGVGVLWWVSILAQEKKA